MPLTKGCQNCSKRRINCDRRSPTCFKCEKRGIQCPGYGLNYRFNDGMASRGKQAGITSEHMYNGQCPITTEQASHLVWKNNHDDKSDQDEISNSTTPTKSPTLVVTKAHVSTSPEMAEAKLMASLETTDARSRELFAHFSGFIASKMVAIDGSYNGYRDIFLPLACEDDLVRMAVSTASMYHLSQQQPELKKKADAEYGAIIKRLRTDAQARTTRADAFRTSIWATIIILLTSETISGGPNLPYLFKMLQHLANANATGGASPLHAFLVEQTKMMTLFALPLLGDSSTVEPVVQNPDRYLDFLFNLTFIHPNHIHVLNLFRLAIRQACTIYLLRSRMSSLSAGYRTLNEAMLTTAIDVLYEICQQTQPEHPGGHTLVWVYFIGAAESSTSRQREFFVERLMAVFEQTKFQNIPKAVDTLESIWTSADNGVPWTDMLPEEMPIFII